MFGAQDAPQASYYFLYTFSKIFITCSFMNDSFSLHSYIAATTQLYDLILLKNRPHAMKDRHKVTVQHINNSVTSFAMDIIQTKCVTYC